MGLNSCGGIVGSLSEEQLENALNWTGSALILTCSSNMKLDGHHQSFDSLVDSYDSGSTSFILGSRETIIGEKQSN